MSADVISAPVHFKPDAKWCFEQLDGCGGDDGALFAVAIAGLTGAQMQLDRPDSAQRNRKVTTALLLAFLALAQILGVPRDDAFASVPE